MARALQLMSAGELVADTLPLAPSRLLLPSLVFGTVAGAAVAVALASGPAHRPPGLPSWAPRPPSRPVGPVPAGGLAQDAQAELVGRELRDSGGLVVEASDDAQLDITGGQITRDHDGELARTDPGAEVSLNNVAYQS